MTPEPEPERIRLFIAASVPDDRLARAAEAVAQLRSVFPGARWVDLSNQHVTLKFLGWTNTDALGAIVAACAEVASVRASARLSLGSLGAFPSRKRVRVLWLGLDDADDALVGMAGDLDRAMVPLGFPAEERAFTPHLTLARFKVPFRMTREWPDLDVDAPPWTVEELGLWRSHLSPQGARYEIVEEFPLGS